MDEFKDEVSKLPINSPNYRFFEKIFTKIEPNFVSDSFEKEDIKVNDKLNESILHYFKNYIIMNAVIKVMDQMMLSKEEKISISSDEVTQGGKISLLYLNAVRKYVPASESSSGYTALHQDFISKIAKEKFTQSERLKFTELVEDNISEFCIKLTEYYGKHKSKTKWKRAFSETVKDLSSRAFMFELQNDGPSQKQTTLQDTLYAYYEEMNRGICMLRKLFDLYKSKFEFELDLADSFHTRALAIHLKLRLFELTMLRETYTKRTLPALRIISDQLDMKRSNLLVQKEDKTFSLQSYQFLGPEYDKMVEIYSRLCRTIENKKWAIETYKKDHLIPIE